MRKEALNGSPDYVSQIAGRNGGYQFPSLGEGDERGGRVGVRGFVLG